MQSAATSAVATTAAVNSIRGGMVQESDYYPYGMLTGESTLTKLNDADANFGMSRF